MFIKNFSLTILVTFSAWNLNAEQGQTRNVTYNYDVAAFTNHDLRTSSTNFITAHRLLSDSFYRQISEKEPSAGLDFLTSAYQFSLTYMTMLWSHEMGHFIRAKQVGGQFNIHDFGLPIPYTTVDLPGDISLEDEASFVTAGFEVNYLNVRHLQSDFIRHNGGTNEDLGLTFANRLMYPIYTTMIVPIDPSDPSVWNTPAGDPSQYILPVFERYSGDQVLLMNGSVNPELVSLYNEATLLAVLVNFADPNFYNELGASFGDQNKVRRPIFLLGNYQNGWTYGTSFNASPLGYEIYLRNYIHINNQQFMVYAKYGRPFNNLGVGLQVNDLISGSRLSADLVTDFWQQDDYEYGAAAEVIGQYKLGANSSLTFSVGAKTEGYLLGKPLDAGFISSLGVSYHH